MKSVMRLACIALLLVIPGGTAEMVDWKFPEGPDACIGVKLNIENALIASGNETVEVSFKGNTTDGLCANTSASETSSSLNVELSNGDKLDFTFAVSGDPTSLASRMDLSFTFDPSNYFDVASETVQMNDVGDTPLGSVDKLYRCISTKTVKFVDSSSTFSMDLTISDVEIQAFNMRGNFTNEVAECADDLAESSTVPASTAPATNTSPEAPVTSNGTSIAPVVTSGAPVTSNGTSEAPATTSGAPVTKNGTTEAPVTTVPPTTQPPVTMPPPPPPAPYEVMKDGKACIIMVASLQLDVLYEKKDNKTDSGYLNVPSNATVTGKCAGVNDTMSTMTISFGRANAARSLTFDFMRSGDGNAMLSSVAVLVDLDSKEFPNAKSGKLNETLNDLKLLQTKENFFFKCDSEQIIPQDDVKDVKIFIRNLQVQAFGIKNGSMSKDGYECTGDTAPIPKSAETAKVNVTEDGNTCIVFNGALTLQIPYNTSTGSKTASINIPQNLSVSGSCGNNGTNTQYLEMNFYDGWKLRLTFQSDAKTSGLLKAAQAGDSYQLSKADLTYVLNNNLFPDVVNPGETAELSGNFTSDALKAKSKGSYLCSKDQTFDLGNGFKMTTKDMQFEAFMSKEFKGFGEASECAKDDETNSIIPIAVGAALAGLVIIVLIAYLIGRRRSRGGYEQV